MLRPTDKGHQTTMYVLKVVEGPSAGFEQELVGPIELGRGTDSGLALRDDPLVSSRHARLTPVDEGVLVEDVGSRNGTYVNGEVATTAVLARPGDVVSVGDTKIEIGLSPQAPPVSIGAESAWVAEVVEGPDADPGRSFDLDGPSDVGRDPTADIALVADERVSWRHARLAPSDGGIQIEDLGSSNGTYVDGERIAAPVVVPPGTRFQVGDTILVARATVATDPAAFVVDVVGGPDAGREVELVGTLIVGRDPTVGLALPDDTQVSRLHARLALEGGDVSIEDLGSRNGTFVNGSLLPRGRIVLRDGDSFVAGSTVLELHAAARRHRYGRASRPPGRRHRAPTHGVGRGYRDVVRGRERPADLDLVICSLAVFMGVLDNLVVLFALPSIQRELHATVQDLEWTVNAFTLAFAVVLLPAATLGDRFGRRRVFASGIGLFTLASAACALAPSVEGLLIARAVQGTGAAVMTPLSLTVLSAAFPAQKRGLVLGAWSGIAGLAIAVGPVVGGVVVTGLDWKWIFWLNVPLGLVIAPLCLLLVKESFGASNRLDPIGIVLSATGLFGVVFGVIRAGAVGWGSPQVIVSILIGAALLAAFIAWERRASDPMLALHLFRKRAFAAANVTSFCMYFGLFGTIFLLAQFLQLVQGYSALEAGLRSLPLTGMPIIVAPIAGALSERIGGRLLMALGLALEAVSFTWLGVVVEPGVAYGKLIAPLILGGIGLGLFFAPVAHVVLGSVKLEEEGQASGANNAIRQVGGVVGVSVMTTIFTAYGGLGTPASFVDGLRPPLFFGAGVLLLGSAIALLIPRPRVDEQTTSMTSSFPAVGGFTPGATMALPTLVAARAPRDHPAETIRL